MYGAAQKMKAPHPRSESDKETWDEKQEAEKGKDK